MDILKIEHTQHGEEEWERPRTFEVQIDVNMGSEVMIKHSFPDVDGRTCRTSVDFLDIGALQIALDFAREAQKEAYRLYGKPVPADRKYETTYKVLSMQPPQEDKELFEDPPKYEEELQLRSQHMDNLLYILRSLGQMPDEVISEIAGLIGAELESQDKKH